MGTILFAVSSCRPIPATLLRGIGRLLDAAKRIAPIGYPITHEAVEMMTRLVPCDSRATVEQLGVQFRPTAETLYDTIRCLYETGEISAKVAGRVANELHGKGEPAANIVRNA